MSDEFQVSGQNPAAKFALKIHRGDGMAQVGLEPACAKASAR